MGFVGSGIEVFVCCSQVLSDVVWLEYLRRGVGVRLNNALAGGCWGVGKGGDGTCRWLGACPRKGGENKGGPIWEVVACDWWKMRQGWVSLRERMISFVTNLGFVKLMRDL